MSAGSSNTSELPSPPTTPNSKAVALGEIAATIITPQHSPAPSSRSWKSLTSRLSHSKSQMSLLSLRGSTRSASPSSRPPSSSDSFSDAEIAKQPIKEHPLPDSMSPPPTSKGAAVKRPALADILANTAPPPWTLAAFMAFLSQNHCLETLEFVLDARRYKLHYEKALAKTDNHEFVAGMENTRYVLALWTKLLQVYVQPNGAREVNIPGQVRNRLIGGTPPTIPPHPDRLLECLGKVHELMQDSVLLQFLNSVGTVNPANIPNPDGKKPGALPSCNSNNASSEDIGNFSVSSGEEDSRLSRRSHKRQSPRRIPPNSNSHSNAPCRPPSPARPVPTVQSNIGPQQRIVASSPLRQVGRTLSKASRARPQSSVPVGPPLVLCERQKLGANSFYSLQQSNAGSSHQHTSSTSSAAASSSLSAPAWQGDPSRSVSAPSTRPISPSEASASTVIAGSSSTSKTWKRLKARLDWRKKSDSQHDYRNSPSTDNF